MQVRKNSHVKFQKGTSLNTAKLDQETEELSHKKVESFPKMLLILIKKAVRSNLGLSIQFPQIVKYQKCPHRLI